MHFFFIKAFKLITSIIYINGINLSTYKDSYKVMMLSLQSYRCYYQIFVLRVFLYREDISNLKLLIIDFLINFCIIFLNKKFNRFQKP